MSSDPVLSYQLQSGMLKYIVILRWSAKMGWVGYNF